MLESEGVIKFQDKPMEQTPCNCSSCTDQVKDDVCHCDKCQPKRDKSTCEWKEVDQLRMRRYPSGKNKQFVWEINCECAGCRGIG